MRAAEQYAVDNAPGLVGKLADTLVPKIIARLSGAGSLPPEATVAPAAGTTTGSVLVVKAA